MLVKPRMRLNLLNYCEYYDVKTAYVMSCTFALLNR